MYVNQNITPSSHLCYICKCYRVIGINMAILTACFYGNLKWADRLLHDDPDQLSAVDHFGRTPLHFAAGSGCTRLVSYLVHKGLDINVMCKNKESPLHWAVDHGHAKVVTLLIKLGAKTSGCFPNDDTLLSRAVRHGSTSVVDILLDVTDKSVVNHMDSNGATALWLACYYGHAEITAMLLDAGANQMANHDGVLPMECAYKNNHRECTVIVKAFHVLLSYRAKRKFKQVSANGLPDLVTKITKT